MQQKRIIFSAIFSLVTINSLNAGQIKVGTGVNGVNGLTNTYMASAANCIGTQQGQAGFAGCVAPAVDSGWAERNYQTTLWAGAVPAQAGPTGETTGLQLTDPNNNVTFAMINENVAGGNNYWAGQSPSTSQTITIPIGVFGVTNAWIMLNDYWGVIGANNTTVTFDFSTTSNGAATSTMVKSLVNGTQIRDATECNAARTTGTNPVDCTTFARTTTAANTSTAFTTSSTGNTIDGANHDSPYTNTSGTLSLDDLNFIFSAANQGLWLTDIKITNSGGSASSFATKTALSAITLGTDATATPEPGTIVMLLGGMGVLAFASRRFRHSQV